MWVRHILRRFGRDTKGIASVEFVMILFPMLLIFFAMIQFGGAFYYYSHMQNVVRDTARRLAYDETMLLGSANESQLPCPGAADTAEEYACSLLLLPGDSGVTVSSCYADVNAVAPATADDRREAKITIVASLSDISLVDLLGIGDDHNVTATAVVRVEEPKILNLVLPNSCT